MKNKLRLSVERRITCKTVNPFLVLTHAIWHCRYGATHKEIALLELTLSLISFTCWARDEHDKYYNWNGDTKEMDKTCMKLIAFIALAATLGAQTTTPPKYVPCSPAGAHGPMVCEQMPIVTLDGNGAQEGFYDSAPDKAKLEKAWQCGLYEASRAMAPILSAETNKAVLDAFKRNGCEAMSEYIHSTQPSKTGPTLPQTCVVGEQYFAWATGDIYVCAGAKNHWKPAPKGGAKK